MQVGYEFQEGTYSGLSVLLQVNNLTDSPEKTEQTAALPNNVKVQRPLDFKTYGRTIMFGINYKM
jgi:TonB dependent receptor.